MAKMKELKLNQLEYEKWLLETLIAKVGYSIITAQENKGYVQFTVRKQVFVTKKSNTHTSAYTCGERDEG